MKNIVEKTCLLLLLFTASAHAEERMLTPLSADETLSYMECPSYNTSEPPQVNMYRQTRLMFTNDSTPEADGLKVKLAILPGKNRFEAEIELIRPVSASGYAHYSRVDGKILENGDGTIEFVSLGRGTPSIHTGTYFDQPAFDVTLTNQTLISLAQADGAAPTANTSTEIGTYGINYGNSDYKHPCDQR